MNPFKKHHFLFFIAIVMTTGTLFMARPGFQRQTTCIPDAQAQDVVPLVSYAPGDYASVYAIYSFQDAAISHPADLFETIMTCWGSRETAATCTWNCGPTFSNCLGRTALNSSGGSSYGWGATYSTCSSAMGCRGATLMTCASGDFCDTGGSTIMTCSMGLLCGRSTLSTCSSGFFCDGGLKTHLTCSAMTGCGSTLITCIPYGCGNRSGGGMQPTGADCSYTMSSSLGACPSTRQTCPTTCQYLLWDTSPVTIPPAF